MNNMKMQSAWWNHKTKEWDYTDFDPKNTDDETAMQYIPQSPPSLALYNLYRKHMGMSIIDAMTAVLEAHVKDVE